MGSTVVLTGFSAAGKTCVGRAIESGFGLSWVDLDEMIENQLSRKVSDIIRVDGEQRFRELEAKALLKAFDERVQVISLGGGALLRRDNKDLIRERGLLVHLAVTPSSAAKRAVADELNSRKDGKGVVRPLIGSCANEQELDAFITSRVKELMSARKGLYNEAKLRIWTDGSSPSRIAAIVVREAELAAQARGRIVVIPFETDDKCTEVIIGESLPQALRPRLEAIFGAQRQALFARGEAELMRLVEEGISPSQIVCVLTGELAPVFTVRENILPRLLLCDAVGDAANNAEKSRLIALGWLN